MLLDTYLSKEEINKIKIILNTKITQLKEIDKDIIKKLDSLSTNLDKLDETKMSEEDFKNSILPIVKKIKDVFSTKKELDSLDAKFGYELDTLNTNLKSFVTEQIEFLDIDTKITNEVTSQIDIKLSTEVKKQMDLITPRWNPYNPYELCIGDKCRDIQGARGPKGNRGSRGNTGSDGASPTTTCSWSSWSCEPRCNSGQYVLGIKQDGSESCVSAGDMDEPKRAVYCCNFE